jgi:hypothetical protein
LSPTLDAVSLALSTPLEAMSFADSTTPYETEFDFIDHVRTNQSGNKRVLLTTPFFSHA